MVLVIIALLRRLLLEDDARRTDAVPGDKLLAIDHAGTEAAKCIIRAIIKLIQSVHQTSRDAVVVRSKFAYGIQV